MLTKRELSLARIGSYTAISDAVDLIEAIDGIDTMVRAHLNAAMNVDLSKEEVCQLIDLIGVEFNEERAAKYRTMFKDVISIRNKK